MNIKLFQKTKENDDGTIVCDKLIIDPNDYDMVEHPTHIIFKPKKKIVKIKKFEDLDTNSENFRGSTPINGLINNKKPAKNKYATFLRFTYDIIGNGTKIINNSLMKCETFEKHDNGFDYYENLGISVQGKDAVGTFKEIVNQCVIHGIKLNIEIKFVSGKIINYVVE